MMIGMFLLQRVVATAALDVTIAAIYIEAYSAAGKTHLHQQVENQREHTI